MDTIGCDLCGASVPEDEIWETSYNASVCHDCYIKSVAEDAETLLILRQTLVGICSEDQDGHSYVGDAARLAGAVMAFVAAFK